MKKKFGLQFFKPTERYSGNWSVLEEKNREWENMYRQRWSHDKVVRTTHGVNCTGSCSWKVFVKNGIITWENQQIDYPSCGPDMPEFEPRGCPRGASFSWYEYSPLRVKYPYMRGKLMKLWRAALAEHKNPVKAWASIVEDPEKARLYKQARGKGGHVRTSWQEATQLIAAQLLYTIQTYGPDRIAGFTPIPAMSMISYASGARFISLLGGEMLSFYDWYADLPPASPQIWGEQTDVPESSDWYNAGYLMMWGSNVPLTRTPDAHFMTEVRYKGTKVVSVAPDYAENVKFADNWLAPNPGTDAALAQAMTHVILDEFYEKRQEPMFINYAKQYTDMPFLILLDEHEGALKAGRFMRASDLGQETAHSEWKPVILDGAADELMVPNGTMGQRWENDVKWNLILKREDGTKVEPVLTMAGGEEKEIVFPYFDQAGNGTFARHIPVKRVTLADGTERLAATVYDLMMSQYGINRGTGSEFAAKSYEDADSHYTPAWQEKITGVKQSIVVQIAREFAQNAIDTGGRSMIIMGAGINHWFNSDTIYRSILNLVVLTASQGVNGGGWAHYVGQEKCRPIEGWSTVAFAKDWQGPPRLQNATSFYYFATDQWKYEERGNDSLKSPTGGDIAYKHPADYNVLAARLGWMPSYPQFNKNSLHFAEEAKQAGKTTPDEIKQFIVDQLTSGETQFAIEDPDAPENFPRTLFVWRSNLVSSSAKGQEYFMKHLFGTKGGGPLASPNENEKPEEIKWRDDVEGKLDLLVALDFRMTATPMYADIVLPAATWYEKTDLSSTDMHPFVHPFNPAVDPLWESRSDWDIYRTIAKEFSTLAETEMPDVYTDTVTAPLAHDSINEIAQPFGEVKDWKKGEIDAIPGKTMPNIAFVERDYTKVYDKYITLGPNVSTGKVGAHGVSFSVAEEYEELKRIIGVHEDETIKDGMPKLNTARQVADAILTLSSATNGKVSQKAWISAEEDTGVALRDISADRAAEKITFQSITAQPREVIPTPVFSGSNKDGKRYSPFTTNIERLVPFRTLTGRQHFYIDHEIFLQYGEALPVYKPTLPPMVFGPKDKEVKAGADTIVLRYLTPHGKWNIHSTYQDNQHMLTLFRGGPTVWINNDDAKAGGIEDNEWLEVYNRNGVVTARAVVSHRMPKGTMFMYHAQDKHINVPGSDITGERGGSHNAPTKIHLKPTQLVGGYAQLSYGFNYYGPIGNQRDVYVAVRKLKEVNWLED